MWTLAIESSGRRGGVALGRDDDRPVERLLEEGMRHGEDLAPAIDELLEEAGIAPADLDRVVGGTGPGSFTGLRIGLAMVKMLAWSLDRPCCGVPSVEATAHGALEATGDEPPAEVCVVVDARLEQVYAARYRVLPDDEPPDPVLEAALEPVGPIEVRPAADLADDLAAAPGRVLVAGDALRIDGNREPLDEAPTVDLAPEETWFAPPALICALGRRADPVDPLGLEPLYVRDPTPVAKARES